MAKGARSSSSARGKRKGKNSTANDGPKTLLSPQEIEEMMRRFAAANPNPTSELFWTNPYTLLVAVVLSAQMTDKGVNKVTEQLFKEVDTPEKMVALGEEKLAERIRSINYYKTKARNVIALSRALVEKYGGEVPHDRKALESLPGVGRKTANVVLNVAFGEPTIAVDTHIFRVANRTGLALGKTPQEVEKILLKVIPEKYRHNAHHWLILHGRYVCKARKPECERCIICDICKWPEKHCAGEELATAPDEADAPKNRDEKTGR
ncbi:endonuclease III [Thermopetrobacter sp. TC1]|uniref:endonuclease III n=1 Tax=Thermopetrobacter sp. TC1 TaxID=1495045 RepID=UPI0009DE1412|nr:endonuclease III [Thermopetrobacter sp. TC1]